MFERDVSAPHDHDVHRREEVSGGIVDRLGLYVHATLSYYCIQSDAGTSLILPWLCKTSRAKLTGAKNQVFTLLEMGKKH